jgi:hypothetical protein
MTYLSLFIHVVSTYVSHISLVLQLSAILKSITFSEHIWKNNLLKFRHV